MTESIGLSAWLSNLLKPAAPPPAAVSAPAAPMTATIETVLAAPSAQAHPNMVALYDRARARESALWQERAAIEPKAMAAFGVFGVLMAGAAIAMNHLAWGLMQWHSPWHVALIALPNLAVTGLGVRWAIDARKTVMELFAERRFPMSSQAGLAEPLSSLGHNPDGLLTGLIQDLHASNNALELSVRKQQEKLVTVVRLLGRLGFVLVLQTAFNVVAERVAVAAPAPAPKAAVAPVAAPVAAPSAQAVPPSPAMTPVVEKTLAPAHPRVVAMRSLQPSLRPSLTPTASPGLFRSRHTMRQAHPALAASPLTAATPTTVPTTRVAPTTHPVASPVHTAPVAVPTKAPAAPEATSHPAAPEPATSSPYIHTP